MPRPSTLPEKRRSLLPRIAEAFVELGYRRATTTQLARRCKVQENILYRLWPDKRAMFIAALGYVYQASVETWSHVLMEPRGDETAAQRLLRYEAVHQGEFGRYRILFSALAETDDPEIRQALADVYSRFHRWITMNVSTHRERQSNSGPASVAAAAWAIVGLATVANIGRELNLMPDEERSALLETIGAAVLG